MSPTVILERRPPTSWSFAATVSRSYSTAAPPDRSTGTRPSNCRRARTAHTPSQSRPILEPRAVLRRRERFEHPLPLQRSDPLAPVRRVTLRAHDRPQAQTRNSRASCVCACWRRHRTSPSPKGNSVRPTRFKRLQANLCAPARGGRGDTQERSGVPVGQPWTHCTYCDHRVHAEPPWPAGELRMRLHGPKQSTAKAGDRLYAVRVVGSVRHPWKRTSVRPESRV